MTVCRAKKCIWRTDVGGNKYYCPVINCPNAIKVKTNEKRQLNVKWLGLEKRIDSYKYRSAKGTESDE